MKILTFITVLALVSGTAGAQMITEYVDYKQGDAELHGYMAYDKSFKEKRPGIIVVHEWWGLGEHPKKSAERLASLGYPAFALDMYGKGKLTEDPSQAGKWSGNIKSNPELAKERFLAAMEVLKSHPSVDESKIGAIGYCFGGTVVLEMARMGVDLDAVVSFHGGLVSAVPEEKKNIKAAILVNHGADDPMVSEEEIKEFWKEMKDHDVDWQMNFYGNAVHSFTNPEADSLGMTGVGYNEKAAHRSWEAMKTFFKHIFGK